MNYINEQYRNLELISGDEHAVIYRDGHTEIREEAVLVEHLMDVYINEVLTMKLVCTPENLAELVLGRLFTEGIIKRADDVEMLYICEYGSRAKVVLRRESCEKARMAERLTRAADGGEAVREDDNGEANIGAASSCRDDLKLNSQTDPDPDSASGYVEITPSCCTGNHILNDYFIDADEVQPVQPIDWKTEWIFDLADRFKRGMPLHGETWATHSCFLSSGGELLFQCEDIGRQNALDKVIGCALRNGVDLTKCVVYSSGRIPTDMAMKAIRAGIPVLASKAVPTREAIQLAGEYGLTLIGAARSDRMKVYAGGAEYERK